MSARTTYPTLTSEAAAPPVASLCLALAAAAVFWLPGAGEVLQLDRVALAAGELWRAVSGHWTHWSLDHLVYDLLAFVVLGVLCERRGRARFLACVGVSALAITAAVWWLKPGMAVYRGLSGVDSALFGLATVLLIGESVRARDVKRGVLFAAFAVGFVAKIVYEFAGGGAVFMQNLPGVATVPLAHIVGGLVGVAVGLLWRRAPVRRSNPAGAAGCRRRRGRGRRRPSRRG